MATVSFKLRGESDIKTIYVRLLHTDEIDIRLSTRIKIDYKHWNNRRGELKSMANFSNKEKIEFQLRQIASNIETEFLKISDISNVNTDWVKKIIDESKKEDKEKKTTLIDLINLKINFLATKNVCNGTIKNYKTTISRIMRYEKFKKTVVYPDDLSINFHSEYFDFAKFNLNLSMNSIGKDIKNIKSACAMGRDVGVKVHENISSKNFFSPSEETSFITLNLDEIDKIIEFGGPNYLENARDWLVIGCWTGCRASDLLNLNVSNIQTVHGQDFIKYRQKKTGIIVAVPIHNHIKQVIEKNNGFPRQISYTKFNEFIKEVCRRSGLDDESDGAIRVSGSKTKLKGKFQKWQLVSSHICRRSFATNHYRFLSNKQIMHVTGHLTEKMLLKYVGDIDYSEPQEYYSVWQEMLERNQ